MVVVGEGGEEGSEGVGEGAREPSTTLSAHTNNRTAQRHSKRRMTKTETNLEEATTQLGTRFNRRERRMMTRVFDSEVDTSHRRKVWAPILEVQRIPVGHHLLHWPAVPLARWAIHRHLHANPSDGFQALSTHSYHTRVDSCAAKVACMDAMCPTSSGLADVRIKLLIAPMLSTNHSTSWYASRSALWCNAMSSARASAHMICCFRGSHLRTTCRVSFAVKECTPSGRKNNQPKRGGSVSSSRPNSHHDASLYARMGTLTG